MQMAVVLAVAMQRWGPGSCLPLKIAAARGGGQVCGTVGPVPPPSTVASVSLGAKPGLDAAQFSHTATTTCPQQQQHQQHNN